MPTPADNVNEALGAGLQFPIRTNQHGGLAVARYEQKVKEAIWAILSTARGERVMRPEFGCDIHSFVFGTVDSTNLTLIKSAVREALVRWEPRIEVNEVEVMSWDPNAEIDTRGMPGGLREGQLLVSVKYTIRTTNSVANLVYPFYMQTGS